jgi:hypothetical protein
VRVDLRIKGLTTGIVVAALALGLLLLPGTAAAGGHGPTATKSGVLVNYASTGKLKIGKRITIFVVCSANCNVDTTTVVKGPGLRTAPRSADHFRQGLREVRSSSPMGRCSEG